MARITALGVGAVMRDAPLALVRGGNVVACWLLVRLVARFRWMRRCRRVVTLEEFGLCRPKHISRMECSTGSSLGPRAHGNAPGTLRATCGKSDTCTPVAFVLMASPNTKPKSSSLSTSIA